MNIASAPVFCILREEGGVAQRDRLIGIVKGESRKRVGEGRAAETRGPRRARFHIRREVAPQMDAGEILPVATVIFVGDSEVAGGRTDGIREPLGRGAEHAAPDAGHPDGVGDLPAEAPEEAVRSDPTLGH